MCDSWCYSKQMIARDKSHDSFNHLNTCTKNVTSKCIIYILSPGHRREAPPLDQSANPSPPADPVTREHHMIGYARPMVPSGPAIPVRQSPTYGGYYNSYYNRQPQRAIPKPRSELFQLPTGTGTTGSSSTGLSYGKCLITIIIIMAFSSLAMIFGESHSFPACTFFFFFLLKWGSARGHRFHFLGQDQATVAQRTKTTVAECSLTSCV